MYRQHFLTIYWLLITCVTLLLFRAVFSQFFSADDWFHLRIGHITSLQEFANFFAFTPTEQAAAFYRPIPTQLFFFVLQRFFGLQAIWWYMVVFIIFLLCLYLLFAVVQRLASEKLAAVTTVLYATSHSNSTRLYFLSAFQEIALVLWTLVCVYGFMKRTQPLWRWVSLVGFWFALLSKETAVVIPGLLLLLLLWEYSRANWSGWSMLVQRTISELWPYAVSLAIYLFLRLGVFGLQVAGHESYAVSFSPSQLANTLLWYSVWAMGAPETLNNYVANFQILDRWWSDFPHLGQPIVMLVLASVVSCFSLGVIVVTRSMQSWRSSSKVPLKLQQDMQLLVFGVSWFLLTLLPVVFFPSHKFALELGLPLIGSALFLAVLFRQSRMLGTVSCVCILALNVLSIELTANTHYSVLRSQTARRVYQLFSTQYPQLDSATIVHFTNDRTDLPSNWGVSKQISESLQGSEFFAVLYPEKSVLAEYADLPHTVSGRSPDITLGSSQFLY